MTDRQLKQLNLYSYRIVVKHPSIMVEYISMIMNADLSNDTYLKDYKAIWDKKTISKHTRKELVLTLLESYKNGKQPPSNLIDAWNDTFQSRWVIKEKQHVPG